MNQMQNLIFPRNEWTKMSKEANCSEWTNRRRRRPNVFIILLKTTKKWTKDDGCHEIIEQNLRIAKIRLKNVTDECCRNFDVDVDKEQRKLNFYYDKN